MKRLICGRCHARALIIEPDGFSLCLSCGLSSRPRGWMCDRRLQQLARERELVVREEGVQLTLLPEVSGG